MTRRPSVLLTFAVLLSVFASGCAIRKEAIKLTPEEYLKLGERHMERKRYDKAQLTYAEMFGYYPRHETAPIALLKAGDSFKEAKAWDPAHIQYRLFYEYYPRHEQVDYVVYNMALMSFESRRSMDRDLGRTHRSLREFKQVLAEFPESPYAPLARQRIATLRQELAEHEYYVGRFYFRFDHYEAAIKRLRGLISDYPDYDDLDEAYLMLGRAYGELNAVELARETLETARLNFPESALEPKFEKALRKLQ